MLTMLKDWKGGVVINGISYKSIKDVDMSKLDTAQELHIKLVQKQKVKPVSESKEYRITVKAYMTKKASPDFDFMAKWNDNNPMPFRTMIGTVVQETRGMIKMKLHADIYADIIPTCMKCGRPLTNKISQYFGVGPECGGHNYVNPFNSDEELKEAVSKYKHQLQKIVWEGWIIKSAILEKEEI